MQFEALAEDAWLLRFGNAIDVDVNARVQAAAAALQAQLADVECVPAYASVLVRFDPMQWLKDGRFSGQRLRNAIDIVLQHASSSETMLREITIPVWYGGAAGEDLHEVAAHALL